MMKIEEKRLKYGLINLIVFFAVLIISEYREYLGIYKGYAPYNFAFNMGFFLPLMCIILIIAIVLFSKTIIEKNIYSNKKYCYLTILTTGAIIIVWIWAIIMLIRNFLKTEI